MSNDEDELSVSSEAREGLGSLPPSGDSMHLDDDISRMIDQLACEISYTIDECVVDYLNDDLLSRCFGRLDQNLTTIILALAKKARTNYRHLNSINEQLLSVEHLLHTAVRPSVGSLHNFVQGHEELSEIYQRLQNHILNLKTFYVRHFETLKKQFFIEIDIPDRTTEGSYTKRTVSYTPIIPISIEFALCMEMTYYRPTYLDNGWNDTHRDTTPMDFEEARKRRCINCPLTPLRQLSLSECIDALSVLALTMFNTPNHIDLEIYAHELLVRLSHLLCTKKHLSVADSQATFNMSEFCYVDKDLQTIQVNLKCIHYIGYIIKDFFFYELSTRYMHNAIEHWSDLFSRHGIALSSESLEAATERVARFTFNMADAFALVFEGEYAARMDKERKHKQAIEREIQKKIKSTLKQSIEGASSSTVHRTGVDTDRGEKETILEILGRIPHMKIMNDQINALRAMDRKSDKVLELANLFRHTFSTIKKAVVDNFVRTLLLPFEVAYNQDVTHLLSKSHTAAGMHEKLRGLAINTIIDTANREMPHFFRGAGVCYSFQSAIENAESDEEEERIQAKMRGTQSVMLHGVHSYALLQCFAAYAQISCKFDFLDKAVITREDFIQKQHLVDSLCPLFIQHNDGGFYLVYRRRVIETHDMCEALALWAAIVCHINHGHELPYQDGSARFNLSVPLQMLGFVPDAAREDSAGDSTEESGDDLRSAHLSGFWV